MMRKNFISQGLSGSCSNVLATFDKLIPHSDAIEFDFKRHNHAGNRALRAGQYFTQRHMLCKRRQIEKRNLV
jgi:hypothetical protein